MAQITINATASLSANGTSTSNGTISWSAPALPAGATQWDSVRISGTWSWTGKGTVSRVTINGVNTSTGIAFDIDITGRTSPLSISCVGGNKNATGNSFSWSGLTVTYTYSLPVTTNLYSKSGGAWQEISVSKVFQKVNGSWVEQSDWETKIDTSKQWLRG